MMNDLRYTFRTLIKTPGFTAVAILTLALGIGANTAIFSVVNAVLLRPLPYQEPGQLIRLWQSRRLPPAPHGPVSPPAFADWRRENHSFERLAAFCGGHANLTGDAEPARLESLRVSADFFAALRVTPQFGRAFLPGEDRAGAGRVAVLSDALWRRRFAADPKAVGRTLTLDNESYAVVGVLPAQFRFAGDAQVFLPLTFNGDEGANRGAHFLSVVGRLKPGVSLAQASTELTALAGRLGQEYAEDKDWSVALLPMQEEVVGAMRTPLFILLGAVAFVLLIACANVANLLLTKASARQKEIAIRAALGANRTRIIRQLLVESVTLSLGGGVLGWLFAYWGLDLLRYVAADHLPRAQEVGLDARVLGFTLLVSALTGIVFGLAPAWQAARLDMNERLKEGGRGAASERRNHTRGLLVISEVALSLVLLIGAGLLLKSLASLRAVDPGFRPGNVLTLQLSLPETRYARNEQRGAFVAEAVRRLEALPGVRAAGAASSLPLSGGMNSYSFEIEGGGAPAGEHLSAEQDSVTPNYFAALGMTLVRGRLFTAQDRASAQPVVVINETVARRFFPNQDPLGRRITIAGPDPGAIVGIVRDVKQYALDRESPPHIYSPQSQKPDTDVTLFVRADGPPMNLASAARAAILGVDHDQPVSEVQPLERVLNDSVAQRRLTLWLLGAFALVALLLAAVGIYGVVAYSVARRTPEIGIRLALGAQRSDVLAMVFKQGMALTLIGIALGLAGAFALTRFLSTLLFGVAAADPATFALVSLALAVVASLACLIPARRATKVDPLAALRRE